jgi:hypothetical protein
VVVVHFFVFATDSSPLSRRKQWSFISPPVRPKSCCFRSSLCICRQVSDLSQFSFLSHSLSLNPTSLPCSRRESWWRFAGPAFVWERYVTLLETLTMECTTEINW